MASRKMLGWAGIAALAFMRNLVGPSPPDVLFRLIFLCRPSLASSHAYNFESVLEEIARAYPDTQIRQSFMLVWTGPNGRIDGLGVTVFSSYYCYLSLSKL